MDIETAKEILKNKLIPIDGCDYQTAEAAKAAIMERLSQPTVVLCKDCEYWEDESCDNYDSITAPDYGCMEGKRRAGEQIKLEV